MSNLVTNNPIESALMQGDLAKLTTEQRVQHFKMVCDSLGLNPLTKPFEYIQLNGKLTLYARKDATDQLRKIHNVSITISERQKIEDIYVVTARGKDKTGREDESTGAVNVAGLKGDALANAFMKAESKAKRRVTLSLCGLGLLDESEVSDIPEVKLEQSVQKLERDLNPKETAEFSPGDYQISFGKFKGQRLSDLDVYELNSYVQYIKSESVKSGKEIKGQVLEFMTASENYLQLKEFGKNDLDEAFA